MKSNVGKDNLFRLVKLSNRKKSDKPLDLLHQEETNKSISKKNHHYYLRHVDYFTLLWSLPV